MSEMQLESTPQPPNASQPMDTPYQSDASKHSSSRAWYVGLLLVVILLIGAYFRLVGIYWGEYQYLHPDERFLVWVGTDISPVKSLAEYFDSANSSLNPVNRGHGFYVYGTLPMFLTRYLVEWIYGHSGFMEMTQVGRPLSALADLLAVLLVYLVAERLYDRRVGLLAAAFSAAAVLQIQLSHFFTTDTFINLFSLLAFYFAVRVQMEAKPIYEPGAPTANGYSLSASTLKIRLRQFISSPFFLLSVGFGVALGMAVASKLNAAPMALALPAAFGLRLLALPAGERQKSLKSALSYLLLAAVISLLTFRLLQPYTFSGPGFFGLKFDERWLANMRELRAQSSGDVDFPPAMQWARRPIWFSGQNLVLWGLGLPLGILAWIGFLWAGWRMLVEVRNKANNHALIWGWTALYFTWQSLALNPTMRYELPIYPMLEIFAAWLLIRLWDYGKKLNWQRVLAILVGVAVLVATYAWAFAFTRIYTRPITRIDASRWIFQNVAGPINLNIQTSDGTYTQLISVPYDFKLLPDVPNLVSFRPTKSGLLSDISLGNVNDPQGIGGSRALSLSVSAQPDSSQPLAFAKATVDLPSGTQSGVSINLPLAQPIEVIKDQTYYINISVTGQVSSSQGSLPTREPTRENVGHPGEVTLHLQGIDGQFFDQPLPAPEQQIPADQPYQVSFTIPQNGTLTEIWLKDPSIPARSDTEPRKFTLALAFPGEDFPLTLIAIEQVNQAQDNTPDNTVRFTISPPVDLSQGESYAASIAYPASWREASRPYLTIRGDSIANEGEWDDGLPLRIDGYDPYGGIYPLDLNFNMYWDDTPEKLSRFMRILDASKYIVISSNRQWGTLPRLPERFPMTTVYYRNLLGCPPEKTILWCYSVAEPGIFQGNLGFDLVKIFQSDPSIGPLRINDQFAEEAFTVYDHPKVLIFRKNSNYDSKNALAILGAVDFSQVIRVPPMRAGSYPANLLLPSERLTEQQQGGTWSELFDWQALQNRYQPIGVILWYISVLLLGLIVYPLLWIAFPGLPDHGYPLARTAGLLLLSYCVWLLGSYRVPFTRLTIFIVIGLMSAIGIILAYHLRDEIRQNWRENRRYYLLVEGLFLAFFVFDLLIRLGNPDLWHPWKGGEKPMDFAYFNAILKSTSFPPYDPWYAGGYLNYYYYGFVFVGVLVKALGIVPSIAYNLILPTIFSLIALGAFSVAYNLTAIGRKEHSIKHLPTWSGIAAALVMAVLGNLGTVRMIYQGYQRLAAPGGKIEGVALLTRTIYAWEGFLQVLKGAHLPYSIGDWYWIPSRAIPAGGDVEPITEFPFFTILYADPHAHLYAMPIALLALTFVTAMVLGRSRWKNAVGWLAAFSLGGLAIGALRPTNTWDFYTYLVLGSVAVAYTFWRYYKTSPHPAARPYGPSLPESSRRLLVTVGAVLLLVALSYLLYQPYTQWYGQGYTKVAIWKGSHTPTNAYLIHWGLFLFVIASWMFWETHEWMANTPLSSLRKLTPYKGLIQGGLLLLVLVVGGLLWMKIYIAWLALPLAAWAGVLLLRPDQPDAKRFTLFLVGTGLVLTLMVELIVLVGDIGRMNTVFKFYLQVWTLFAVSAGAALGWLLLDIPRWLPGWRNTWATVLTLLVAGAALYTVLGGMAKVKDRMTLDAPNTLDGMEYMAYAHYNEEWGDMDLSQDYRAIRWLQENVQGSPVIVEANLRNLYRWGSRYSIYTGLPGVVGWEWHQQQQRAVVPSAWISNRITEVDNFYLTTDLEQARSFLRKYNVRYIILGQQERGHYPGAGLAKFASAEGVLWQQVYQEQNTAIYEVID